MRTSIWVDAGGRTRMTIVHTGGTSDAASINAELQSLSNGGVLQFWESDVTTLTPGTTAAPYADVADYADLLFRASADGSIAHLTLAAPQAAIFLADGATVDPTAIAGLIVACLAGLQTASGATVDTYLGGVRRRGGWRDY